MTETASSGSGGSIRSYLESDEETSVNSHYIATKLEEMGEPMVGPLRVLQKLERRSEKEGYIDQSGDTTHPAPQWCYTMP